MSDLGAQWRNFFGSPRPEPPKQTRKRPPKKVLKVKPLALDVTHADGSTGKLVLDGRGPAQVKLEEELAASASGGNKRERSAKRKRDDEKSVAAAVDTSQLHPGYYPDPNFAWKDTLPTQRDEFLWQRPPVAGHANASSEYFEFQILKTESFYVRPDDHRQNKFVANVPGSAQIPLVRMFGVTEQGNSVCVNTWNFYPHFMVRAPSTQESTEEGAKRLHRYMENTLRMLRDERNVQRGYAPKRARVEVEYDDETGKKTFHRRAWEPGPLVIDVEPVKMFTMEYYQKEKQNLYRIYVRTPNLVSMLRDFVHEHRDGLHIPQLNATIPCTTYESKVKFETRFLTDHRILGAGWVRIPYKDCQMRANERSKDSRCQIELDVDSHSVEGMAIADFPDVYERPSNYRIMSYDIEAKGDGGVFPVPEKNEVIQICAVLAQADKLNSPLFEVQLCVGSVEDADKFEWLLPVGSKATSRCLCFKTEAEMLRWWAIVKRTCDYDILTGYNTKGFDDRYVFLRSQYLNVALRDVGRLKNVADKLEKKMSSSAQYGNRETFMVHCSGRIGIDVLEYVRAERKERSYKLNTIAIKYLGDQKEDMSYDQIPILQNGTAADRRLLVDYCKKDALLPLELMAKLDIPTILIERSRVQCCQLHDQQDNGSTHRVFSQLLHHVLDEYAIMADTGDYVHHLEGATVVPPKRGFYDSFVVTLDFASLYPSIARAFNLCISTLIRDAERHLWDETNSYTCPQNHQYVKKSVREGVLPKLFSMLLNQRGYVKKLMAAAITNAMRSLYDGRQLGLKISANSVYGFTSRRNNGTYYWQIGDSITALGRMQLELTKRIILSHFTIENGYEANAEIIYGDTDSVMVTFNIKPAPRPAWIESFDAPSLTPEQLAFVNKMQDGGVPLATEPSGVDECRGALFKAWRKKSLIDAANRTRELSFEAARLCNKEYVKPNELEAENMYYPYLLLSKKRYAGVFWGMKEKAPNGYEYSDVIPDKKKVQGLEMKRRDNAYIVMKTQERVLDIILDELDPKKAFQYLCDTIGNLVGGKYDLKDLIITKELKKYAEDYATAQPQAQVHAKIKARAPGTEPRLGDRVPYVMVVSEKGARAADKAEDPMYVIKERVKIDVDYYVRKQLLNPMVRVFKHLIPNAKNRILNGPHMKYKKHFVSKSPLERFLVARATCINCRAPVTQEGNFHNSHGLCLHCITKIEDIERKSYKYASAETVRASRIDKYLEEHVRAHSTHIEKRARLEDRCKTCQGDRYGHVRCANIDCEIFFTRFHSDRDVASEKEIVDALSHLKIDAS